MEFQLEIGKNPQINNSQFDLNSTCSKTVTVKPNHSKRKKKSKLNYTLSKIQKIHCTFKNLKLLRIRKKKYVNFITFSAV